MWESIKEFGQSIVDVIYQAVKTLMTFVSDVFFFVLENVMQGAIALLDTFGTGLEGLNPTQYITAIPAETKGMMAACGFNECITIVVSAIGIRLILQLIPFVRWGS
tara:strand:- start:36 stop:353 length:318 start_codon:yes stop_codon:yes gene_type:complete